MKSIEKIFKWIWKNKEWVFSGIGITLLTIIFSMLFNNPTSNLSDEPNLSDSHNQNNGSYMEIQDNNGNIYQNSTINNYESEEGDDGKQEIVMSEAKYLEYLHSNVDGEIVFYHYNDYDGDGSCEMFALVGEVITSTLVGIGENLNGKIWYINENGMMEVESNEIEYWTSPYKFTVDNKIFIAFEEAYVTGSQSYIWGVRNGKPYQPNISGKVSEIKVNEYDEIEVIHSTYDIAYDKEFDIASGHTWKKYYFYFDGSTFREYGGINIKIEDIVKIPEIKKIVDEVDNSSYVIDSIYYRDNHVININISHEFDEYIGCRNITLRYIDDIWKVVPSDRSDRFDQDYGEGIYLKAFIPTVATYPDEFPY